MVRAVHVQLIGLDDAVQQRPRLDTDRMAGFGPRIGLFVSQGTRDLVGDVLDQRTSEDHVQELLAAADAEHWHVALERATGDSEFEIGARCLEFDGVVPVLGTEQGGIDVEVAAGDDQSVDSVEVCGRPPGRVRQEHGQSTRAVYAGAVVLANGIPWLV